MPPPRLHSFPQWKAHVGVLGGLSDKVTPYNSLSSRVATLDARRQRSWAYSEHSVVP